MRCREGDRPPSCGVAARSCGGVLVTGPPQSSLDVLGKLVGVEERTGRKKSRGGADVHTQVAPNHVSKCSSCLSSHAGPCCGVRGRLPDAGRGPRVPPRVAAGKAGLSRSYVSRWPLPAVSDLALPTPLPAVQVTHPLVAANQLLHTWHTLDRDLAHLRAWHVNHVLMGASSAGDGPLTLQDVHVARHKWADLTLNDPVKALAVWVMAVEAGLSHAQCWWRLEDVAAHPGLAGRVCEAVAASRELPATDLGCYAREDAWGGQVEAGLSNAGLPPPSLVSGRRC